MAELKAEVEQLMATFNTHREDLQKQLVEAQKDKEVMAEFQQTLYVSTLLLLLFEWLYYCLAGVCDYFQCFALCFYGSWGFNGILILYIVFN